MGVTVTELHTSYIGNWGSLARFKCPVATQGSHLLLQGSCKQTPFPRSFSPTSFTSTMPAGPLVSSLTRGNMPFFYHFPSLGGRTIHEFISARKSASMIWEIDGAPCLSLATVGSGNLRSPTWGYQWISAGKKFGRLPFFLDTSNNEHLSPEKSSIFRHHECIWLCGSFCPSGPGTTKSLEFGVEFKAIFRAAHLKW